MEFRRINALPPYVFGIMDALKIEARRAGEDVVDLGFGNPDLPSPDVAVEKLACGFQHCGVEWLLHHPRRLNAQDVASRFTVFRRNTACTFTAFQRCIDFQGRAGRDQLAVVLGGLHELDDGVGSGLLHKKLGKGCGVEKIAGH